MVNSVDMLLREDFELMSCFFNISSLLIWEFNYVTYIKYLGLMVNNLVFETDCVNIGYE